METEQSYDCQESSCVSSHGGPRCCKRNTFLALIEAVKLVGEYFGVSIAMNGDLRCESNTFDKECLRIDCPFYNSD